MLMLREEVVVSCLIAALIIPFPSSPYLLVSATLYTLSVCVVRCVKEKEKQERMRMEITNVIGFVVARTRECRMRKGEKQSSKKRGKSLLERDRIVTIVEVQGEAREREKETGVTAQRKSEDAGIR